MARRKNNEVTVVENRKDNAMQQNQQQEFNYFEYFKFQVLKQFFIKQFRGEDTSEVTIQIKNFDNMKSTWFYKNGAMKFISWSTTFTEEGKQVVEVHIKDINLDAKATSKKTGKEFKVFSNFDIAKAVKAAQRAIAA